MQFSFKAKRHFIDLLFTLSLFCVFAVSCLFVIIFGANVYKSTSAAMNHNYNIRTSLSYVCEKVRQNDTVHAIRIDALNSSDALVLTQSYNDTAYETWIYSYQGSLMELYIPKGNDIDPSFGNPIMDVPSFAIEQMTNELYRFTITDSDGTSVSQIVHPRCAS